MVLIEKKKWYERQWIFLSKAIIEAFIIGYLQIWDLSNLSNRVSVKFGIFG